MVVEVVAMDVDNIDWIYSEKCVHASANGACWNLSALRGFFFFCNNGHHEYLVIDANHRGHPRSGRRHDKFQERVTSRFISWVSTD